MGIVVVQKDGKGRNPRANLVKLYERRGTLECRFVCISYRALQPDNMLLSAPWWWMVVFVAPWCPWMTLMLLAWTWQVLSVSAETSCTLLAAPFRFAPLFFTGRREIPAERICCRTKLCSFKWVIDKIILVLLRLDFAEGCARPSLQIGDDRMPIPSFWMSRLNVCDSRHLHYR